MSNFSDHIGQQSEIPKSRANACFLLARLWSHEIGLEYLTELSTSRLGAAYRDAGGWLPTSKEISQQLVDEMSVEFGQCFLGPSDHLLPFQSAAEKGHRQAECCDSLKEFAAIVGPIEAQGFQSQPMPDHASLELAMMGQLQLSLYAAVQLEDDQTAASVHDTVDAFFPKHLQWLIDYCALASSRSQSRFYGSVFNVTGQFLQSEFGPRG